MGYFPFFVDIENLSCLIIGGGKVALRKIEKLSPFGVKIKVVSIEVCKEISDNQKIEIIRRKFAPSDLDGADFVISATGDENANNEIFRLCKERKIPVNTVDDKEKCTFLFPSLICSNDITVGISTGGKSPLFAKYFRERIEQLLDETNLEAVSILGKYRPLIKEKIPTQQKRQAVQEKLLEMLLGGKTDDKQIKTLIEEFI